MARTINEIQQQIINQVQADAVLSTKLTSTSKTAVWNLYSYIVAVCIWSLENLFDLFRIETNNTIAAMKPHSLRWYAAKAKAFQYGFNLVAEADYYNNTGIDESAIEASKIIDHAAVVEQTRGLRIKVARETGADLGPLSAPQLNAFIAYMQHVKDAGVKLLITSTAADNLKLNITIYYNPLVLNSNGGRLDGISATPVQDAIKNYLKNLPFNGVFLTQSLVDVLQRVEGVAVIDVVEVQAQYGALAFNSFRSQYIPDAGYLRITDNNLSIAFIPYSE